MFLEEYLKETSTSALSTQVKEMAAYMCCAALGQAQTRKFFYRSAGGVLTPFQQIKILSLSFILCGKPGSFKSETIRLMKRIMRTAGLPVYPHDQVTREYLLSTLSKMAVKRTDGKAISMILVEELVNFLNRREYVEPLVGTLNSLLDQPDDYGVGTHKRGTETLKSPLVSFFGACAPSWFQYLPEALFTGGFAGRCLFYWVPYPAKEDRQPRGQAAHEGAAERLGKTLKQVPDGDLILTQEAIRFFDQISNQWSEEDAHPLPVIDEWLKRRAIQTVRLAGAVAMADFRTDVTKEDMDAAHKHLEHVTETVENVWFEVGGDIASQHRMLRLHLHSKLGWKLKELEEVAIKYLRSPMAAHKVIDWWLQHQILRVGKNDLIYLDQEPASSSQEETRKKKQKSN